MSTEEERGPYLQVVFTLNVRERNQGAEMLINLLSL